MTKQYRLPSGNYTTSLRRYVSEWKKLTEAVEKKLEARVYAFDPGVAVCRLDGSGSATLPLWVATKIACLDSSTDIVFLRLHNSIRIVCRTPIQPACCGTLPSPRLLKAVPFS